MGPGELTSPPDPPFIGPITSIPVLPPATYPVWHWLPGANYVAPVPGGALLHRTFVVVFSRLGTGPFCIRALTPVYLFPSVVGPA